jgi:hypothetical protein
LNISESENHQFQFFGGKYEPKNLNTNIAIPVLSGYLILLIFASSSSLNILEPENCQFWFFGKQFRIKELPVLVLWKTIQDQRTASSGSLENNSGLKNCQFWFFGKQFRIKELPVLVLWKTIQD